MKTKLFKLNQIFEEIETYLEKDSKNGPPGGKNLNHTDIGSITGNQCNFMNNQATTDIGSITGNQCNFQPPYKSLEKLQCEGGCGGGVAAGGATAGGSVSSGATGSVTGGISTNCSSGSSSSATSNSGSLVNTTPISNVSVGTSNNNFEHNISILTCKHSCKHSCHNGNQPIPIKTTCNKSCSCHLIKSPGISTKDIKPMYHLCLPFTYIKSKRRKRKYPLLSRFK